MCFFEKVQNLLFVLVQYNPVGIRAEVHVKGIVHKNENGHCFLTLMSFQTCLFVKEKYNVSQWEPKLFLFEYFSKYPFLCFAEESNAYRFGTT